MFGLQMSFSGSRLILIFRMIWPDAFVNVGRNATHYSSNCVIEKGEGYGAIWECFLFPQN
ncbi:hypothetical protein BLOT_007921 [Blomia tropicalis]|nr:hypothetical protein BLOT_007921 [Blomia tropicalis]